MKNRITPILVILIVLMAAQLSFGQNTSNNYGEKKASFYKQYKEYLNSLGQNPNAVKPTDANGLFYINENNKFSSTTERNSNNISDNIQPTPPVTETVAPYVWSQTSGTYTPIAGTALGTAANDDEIFAAVPIGFTFVYDGISYTTVGVSNNGYLKFGATPVNTYLNVLSAQTLIYAGFNTDMIGNGTTSSLSYTTSGSAPNRIFTVQWSAMTLYNGGPDASVLNVQMTLNETTNKISTIFGAMTVITLGYTPQCGINTTTSDFNVRTTLTDWNATTAGGTNTSNCAFTNVIKPASGQTWTWGAPPLCGTYTIPGSYATVAAAISDLNSRGVCGTSAVTFNITPGYTETIPNGGYVINIPTNMPTAAGPVIFQRNGAGTNPLLSSNVAGSGLAGTTTVGGNGTAFIKLVGTDYITFNNISLQELYTGATQTLKMQYGFMMVRASATDGCKNVTISGSVINMSRLNVSSCGIATLNVNAAHTVTDPTSTAGRHENISVQGCTINNSFNGMYFNGFAALTPFDLYDHFYNIGTVTGNNLTNIGSVGAVNTNNHWGIYAIYLDSLRILNNTVNVNTGTNNATHYGIFTSTGTNSSCDITNNTVSDTADGTVTSGSQQAGIYNTFGASGTDNRVNITNNTVKWCRYFNAGAPTCYYLANFGGALTVNITGNFVDSNTTGGQAFSTATSTMYGITNSAANTTVTAVHTVANNTVRNMTRTQSAAGAGNNYGIYLPTTGYLTNVNNNTVKNLYNGTTTGVIAGIFFSATTTTVNVYNNTVSDLTKIPGVSTTGAMYGTYQSSGTPNSANYGNTIFNLSNSGTTAATYGYYDFATAGTGYENVYNNTVYNFSSNTSGVMIGLYVSNGLSTNLQTKDVYGNTVYNLFHSGTGQTGGINVNYTVTGTIYNNKVYKLRTNNIASSPAIYGMLLNSTVTTVDYRVYNNMIHELYSPVDTSGLNILALWINGGDSSLVAYNSIYLDSSGLPSKFGAYALYLAGTINATLKNNIIVNKTVPTGSGANIGVFKAAGVVYSTASNNNNVYIPAGASNFFYYDGTTTYSTLATYKAAVAPAETNTFSENSPFLNTTTSPYNLHMSTVIPTACESGGIPVVAPPISITTDIDGNTRNVTTPDVGADEFAGLPAVITVNLNIVPGGFYNTVTGKLNMKDTVRAYLVDSVGCVKRDSAKGVVDSVTFLTSFTFNNAPNGNYFLVVKHRNHLIVSSSTRISVTRGSVTAYNFTDAGTKAYGSNMVQVSVSPVVWGMIPGDINQDQFVDGLDQTLWVGQSGLDGYLRGDLNGDGFVDGLDQTLWVPFSGLSSVLPCGFTRPNQTKIFDGTEFLKEKQRQQPKQGTRENRK